MSSLTASRRGASRWYMLGRHFSIDSALKSLKYLAGDRHHGSGRRRVFGPHGGWSVRLGISLEAEQDSAKYHLSSCSSVWLLNKVRWSDRSWWLGGRCRCRKTCHSQDTLMRRGRNRNRPARGLHSSSAFRWIAQGPICC